MSRPAMLALNGGLQLLLNRVHQFQPVRQIAKVQSRTTTLPMHKGKSGPRREEWPGVELSWICRSQEDRHRLDPAAGLGCGHFWYGRLCGSHGPLRTHVELQRMVSTSHRTGFSNLA